MTLGRHLPLRHAVHVLCVMDLRRGGGRVSLFDRDARRLVNAVSVLIPMRSPALRTLVYGQSTIFTCHFT